MSALVLAEHDNAVLKDGTFNTVTAALKLDKDVHVLVAGKNCKAVAEAAAKIAGVSKVLLCDDAAYEHPLAEGIAPLLAGLTDGHSAILAPATTSGKNILPRVAAALDVMQISEIVSVKAADTFKRPIYAGNAIQTVQSLDKIKVITVRTTAFEAAKAEGGSAAIETVKPAEKQTLSTFVKAELSKSDRPELTSAKIVISGGRGMGSGENFKLLEQIGVSQKKNN